MVHREAWVPPVVERLLVMVSLPLPLCEGRMRRAKGCQGEREREGEGRSWPPQHTVRSRRMAGSGLGPRRHEVGHAERAVLPLLTLLCLVALVCVGGEMGGRRGQGTGPCYPCPARTQG